MTDLTNATGLLRQHFQQMKSSPLWSQIVEPRDVVIARFQPMFTPAKIESITPESFRPFLLFENNKHWTGLHRHFKKIASNPKALTNGLSILVDEGKPIEERLNQLDGYVAGMGRAIMTAVLQVTYPEKYGVWNDVVVAGMEALGVSPEFDRGESFGSRYVKVNTILTELASEVGVSLWTLDALWWPITRGSKLPVGLNTGGEVPDPMPPSELDLLGQSFGLERHLHDFLYDNWDQTALGKEWEIFAEPGEPDAGYEYITPIGRIDLLARHRKQKKWLVIELKRKDTTDATVGQAARYMGWVREHLAEPGDEVHGLIIAQQVDEAMHYAVCSVPNLTYQLYEVEFRLKPATRKVSR